MLLTRIPLHVYRATTRGVIDNPQALHAAVARMVAPGSDDRLLWRVERSRNGDTHLYVSSTGPVLAEEIAQTYGWPGEYRTADLSPVLDGFTEGQVRAFRLLAAPAVSRRRAEGGKYRVPLTDERATADWLARQGQRHGFALVADHLTQDTLPVASFARGGAQARVSGTEYTGRLRITDPAAFRAQLPHGFGPQKAYGRGLLLVAPEPVTAD